MLQPTENRHAGLAKPFRTACGDRIRIADGVHHARDAGREQRIGARRRLSGVIARLQCDKHGRTARAIAGGVQGHNFRVWAAVPRVPSFADNDTVAHHDRPDHRVGRSLPHASTREIKGSMHVWRVRCRRGVHIVSRAIRTEPSVRPTRNRRLR